MAYDTLTTYDRLVLARDVLRGRESDHFRLSLLDEPNKEQRLLVGEAEIERIRAEVEALESKWAEEESKRAALEEKRRAASGPRADVDPFIEGSNSTPAGDGGQL